MASKPSLSKPTSVPLTYRQAIIEEVHELLASNVQCHAETVEGFELIVASDEDEAEKVRTSQASCAGAKRVRGGGASLSRRGGASSGNLLRCLWTDAGDSGHGGQQGGVAPSGVFHLLS